ncbi:hypothetical protein [Embleya sp. MST-111070]|uniref:hypothetical protein n=1 Tax=Embleya sp. MST-111070 TaxID=3398231 RepID=UPI003F73AD42
MPPVGHLSVVRSVRAGELYAVAAEPEAAAEATALDAGTTDPPAVLADTVTVGEYLHAVRALHYDAFAPPET